MQSTWALCGPFADTLTVKGARLAGLPTDAAALADLVAPDERAALAAALVAVARQPGVLDELG